MIITHTDTKFQDTLLEQVETLCTNARVKILGDATKQKEYELAEEAALTFKKNGYTGIAPMVISSWAAIKGWSAKEAADDILAAAERSRNNLLRIRDIRMTAKDKIKNAKTANQASLAFDTFKFALFQVE